MAWLSACMAPSPLPKAVAPMMAAAIIWLRASILLGSATATGSQRPIKAMPEAAIASAMG